MADEPDNLVLALLRKISAEQSILRETTADQRDQLNPMRLSLIGMREDLKAMAQEIASGHVRYDRIDDRLTRIETRLGLIEA